MRLEIMWESLSKRAKKGEFFIGFFIGCAQMVDFYKMKLLLSRQSMMINLKLVLKNIKKKNNNYVGEFTLYRVNNSREY